MSVEAPSLIVIVLIPTMPFSSPRGAMSLLDARLSSSTGIVQLFINNRSDTPDYSTPSRPVHTGQ